MTTQEFVPLRGPNRWSSSPILELHVGNHPTLNGEQIRSIADNLIEFLNSKKFNTSHPQSVSNAEHIVKLLASSNDSISVWLLLARWFSAMAGVPTQDLPVAIETRNPIPDGQSVRPQEIVLAMEMEEPALSERCYGCALEWLTWNDSKEPFPLAQRVRELFDFADDVRLGPSSRAILRAARRRNIPYTRMNQGSLVQLGEGKRQRRIWTAETDATSAIAEAIASDKDLTKRLLRQVGVPVPHGRTVTDADDAWLAAQEIGFPVVVKPCNANHQRGISIELDTREDIRKAYEFAVLDGQTQDILVEQFAAGHHHRLLVVGDRMVAAAMGHAEYVRGDGTSTVEQLIAEENRDHRRGEAYTDPLGVIAITDAVKIELSKQGFTLQSIPEKGREVLIRRTGDLTTDCTQEVHPMTAEQAVLAARVVGLDIAGLDILATDIRRPLEEQRGAVVEVNAGPALSPHVSPLYGKPQKVGDAIVDMLFPKDMSARIKIVGIVQSNGSSKLMEQFAEQLRLNNVDFGTLSNGRAGFNGRVVDTGCVDDYQRVTALLCNPILSALLIEVDPANAAQLGVCAPRLDRVLFPQSSIPGVPGEPLAAGIRAILNAVPSDGCIFADHLPAEATQWILQNKKSNSALKNSFDGALELSI